MDNEFDDTQDNVEKIKKNIDLTIHNMEVALDMIETTTDKKKKVELQEKNQRRAQAIPSMVKELKEEEAKKELEDM